MANAAKSNIKRALAKRTGHFEHLVEVGDHRIATDEPVDMGGQNAGPSPQELLAASLASCTATTIEMYASHKGWDVGGVKVKCEFEPAKRGAPTTFNVVVCVPPGLDEEQTRRVMEIAAKCPVHRTLEGEVIFNETMIVQ
ncbi:MAG: OsmC family protein [Actinobacteria bacterium]|nr:OsmC family protein [Actinomycetota bacterium]